MDEIEVTSWEQFAQIVDHLDVGDPDRATYAFRGQADAIWDLKPTLVRRLRQFGATEEQALRIEELALAEFKSQAHLHISPNILSTTTDTISWWTLMQHHGAPTRLLDWCASMYVAAYFAVSGHPKSAGAVWAVHTRSVNSLMADKYEWTEFPKTEAEIKKRFLQAGAPPVLIFTGRLSKTHRMVAQQGFFSICRNVLGNHGEILPDIVSMGSEKELFRKIIIPAGLKTIFLRKLRSMNITANSLFPGLDGLARSVNELIQVVTA